MLNSFNPQILWDWGWVIIPVLIVAIVWAIIKIRKRYQRTEFRKCTDVFLEERFIRGELIRKNVPKRV